MELLPVLFFAGMLILFWLGIALGSQLHERHRTLIEPEKDLLKTVQGALLTLFGLLLGFMFSMAVGRYELRKQLIVDEANAIATAWVRTALLVEPTRTEQQQLLRQYVPIRVEYLDAGSDTQRMNASLDRAGTLQRQLWSGASLYAETHRDSTTPLYLAALNQTSDLFESRTAAFENRIPLVAWAMLVFIGFVATLTIGLTVVSHSQILRLLLPLVFALALFLTFDLDNPRQGLIHTGQASMERLSQEMAGTPPGQ